MFLEKHTSIDVKPIFNAPIIATIDHKILLYFCFIPDNFAEYIIKQTIESIIPIKGKRKIVKYVFSIETIALPVKSTNAGIVSGILLYTIGKTIMGIKFKTKETINNAIN